MFLHLLRIVKTTGSRDLIASGGTKHERADAQEAGNQSLLNGDVANVFTIH